MGNIICSDFDLQIDFDPGGCVEGVLKSLKDQIPKPSDAGVSGDCSLTAVASVSAVGGEAIKEYLAEVGVEEFLAKIKLDCESRLDDVRKTNSKALTLSAFLSIPALIGYLARLACARNDDFLVRIKKLSHKKTGFNEGDYKAVANQIDGASYLEFVNRFMLQGAKADWEKDNGVAKVLYGMVRCGLLHGQTLQFNRELKDDSYVTTSPVSPETQQRRLGKVICKITHDVKFSRSLAELEKEIQSAAGAEVELIFCASTLCDEIQKGIGNMFKELCADAKLKESVRRTFELDTPICFVDFDEELKKERERKHSESSDVVAGGGR